MKKRQGRNREEKEEKMITQQIAESYQSGLIEPETDTRAREK
ncbi:hypothetical protein [Salinibacillus xinjiangensis]|nr:hypothetical protein [Salinibacillus xinjiangensis]